MSRLWPRVLTCLFFAAAAHGAGGPERPSPFGPLWAARAAGLGQGLALGAGDRSAPPLGDSWGVVPLPEPLSPSVPRGVTPLDPVRVLWRFRSASPVSGPPGVSDDGRVYVTSVEGYVHALARDGSFRWSYGVGGIPLGAPAVDAAGGVYVATSEGRLYALGADGQLVWASGAFSARFASPPVWVEGSVYVAGRDYNLYGLSGGGPPSRCYLGEAASGALANLGAGLVGLGTARAALLYRRAAPVARLELGAPLSQPLLGGVERWFAVTVGGVSAFDVVTHELLWSAPARRAALSQNQRSLVVEADRELRWLSPRTGEVLGRAPLPEDVSAEPALTNAGVALVPMVSGELWVVNPLAPVAASIGIGPAPLWAPVYDEASGRVTVAAGASVVALELASDVGVPEPAPRAGTGGGGA